MISLNLRLFMAFLLALVLTILPVPELLAGARPPWVLLLVLYLQFYMPDYFKVTVLFVIGLFLDVLLSTTIGEHALALSLITWLANNKARRFYFFSIGQQMTLVGFLCLFYQLIIVTIDAFLGFHMNLVNVVSSAVISVLVWPWLRLVGEETLLTKIKHSRSSKF
ncbi:MAG: rod shape-determining protein MreD [Legionella sp.]|nr:rod shape-determining protein MreD [Legionella sp.]